MTDLISFARGFLARVYEEQDFKNVDDRLRANLKSFQSVPKEKFAAEFLAAKLALACRVWEECCREEGLQEEETQKIFLKIVMQCFHSSETVTIAEAFSEYLYATDLEGEAKFFPALIGRLFTRLGLERPKDSDAEKVSMVGELGMLAALFEGMKTFFGNEFFEVLSEHRLRGLWNPSEGDPQRGRT